MMSLVKACRKYAARQPLVSLRPGLLALAYRRISGCMMEQS